MLGDQQDNKPAPTPGSKPQNPDEPNPKLLRNIKGHDDPPRIGEQPGTKPFRGIQRPPTPRKPSGP